MLRQYLPRAELRRALGVRLEEEEMHEHYVPEREPSKSLDDGIRRRRRQSLLENAFLREIVETEAPRKFKISSSESYNEKLDPIDHVASFKSALCLSKINTALKCSLFFMMPKESALRWFNSLLVGVITSFGEFEWMFVTQFASMQKPLKNSQALLKILQELSESLRSFVTRFQNKMLDIRDLELVVTHNPDSRPARRPIQIHTWLAEAKDPGRAFGAH